MILGFFTNSIGLEIWAERMFAASWQAGLLLSVAWLVSRFCRAIPTVVRCWIWRIAYLKFAIVIFLGCVLQLPVLPAWSGDGLTRDSLHGGQKLPTSNSIASVPSVDLRGGQVAGNASRFVPESEHLPADISVPAVVSSGGSGFLSFSGLLLAFGLWGIGLGVSLFRIGLDCLRMRRLVKGSRPLSDRALIQRYRMLCGRFRLSRCPAIGLSSDVNSPVLVGIFRATILIPVSLVKTSGVDELSLILAHELAHCRRRDLVWNWLPVMVRAVFFFHPLVWLTESRFSLDQEIACDQWALKATRAERKLYGDMLVRVSSRVTAHRSSLAVLGVASSFKILKLRILDMYQCKPRVSLANQVLSIVALVVAAIIVLPIHLVAQDDPQENGSNGRVVEVASEQPDGKSPKPQSTDRSKWAVDVNPNEAVGPSKDAGQPEDVSISVAKGEKAQSLQIKWGDSGRANVVYTKTVGSDSKVWKYDLKKMSDLAKKNRQAWRFYRSHVSDSSNRSGNVSSRAIGKSTGEMGGIGLRRPARATSIGSGPTGEKNQNPSSQSSSSSAFQSSSMTNNNGNITQSQDSNTTGNGIVGGGAGSKQEMAGQIQRMIEQTDNPQMQEALRKMLEQFGGK